MHEIDLLLSSVLYFGYDADYEKIGCGENVSDVVSKT